MTPIEQVRLAFGLLQEVYANALAEADQIEASYQTLARMLRMGEAERVEALAAVLHTAKLLEILQSLLINSASASARELTEDEHRENLRQVWREQSGGGEEESWRSE